MGSLIYTTLRPGQYQVTSDTGAVRDTENLFVTRRRSIVFRGTEHALIQAFPIGGGGSPSGGNNMLCAGITSFNLCEGTASNPHWECEINWVGLHSSYSKLGAGNNDVNFNYRILSNWARSEVNYPIEGTSVNGGQPAPYTIIMPARCTTYPYDPVSGNPIRGRVIHMMPLLQVIGVIRNESSLILAPTHPALKALISALNVTHKPPDELIASWDGVPDMLHTYSESWLLKDKQKTKLGGYVPAGMQSHRHLSFGPIHAFTLDLVWEQGRSPG